jgi:hypothetical protein
VTFTVRIGGPDIGERLDGVQFGRFRLQRHGFDLGNHVEHLPVLPQVSEQSLRDGALEQHVDAYLLALRVCALTVQNAGYEHAYSEQSTCQVES